MHRILIPTTVLRALGHVERTDVDSVALCSLVKLIKSDTRRKIWGSRENPHVFNLDYFFGACIDNTDAVAVGFIPKQFNDPIGTIERTKKANLELSTGHLLGNTNSINSFRVEALKMD